MSSSLAVAVVAMAPLVEAQPAKTNAWKPIIFSSPAGNEISSNPISPSTQPLAPADFRGLFQDAAPIGSFNDFGPVPAPVAGGRFPKSARDRQEWIFMTPAEILGVSSNQLLQTGKLNENDQREDLSPMERYLERRNPSIWFNPSGDPSRSRNSWEQGNDQTNSNDNSSDLMDSGPDAFQSPLVSSQFPNTAPGNDSSADPNKESFWSKLFGSPALQPTPNTSAVAQQQAELNQFQQMLNPGSVPVTAATSVPDNTPAFKPQNNFPVTDSTQPLVNPVGASFTPLNSGIGQPAAVPPLPGITRPAGIPALTAPTWAPQMAPWLSQNPQPFAIPQRKF
ncbi:MAG TPA: hypothetical protein VMA35_11045 [Candidatus Sulfopaludibacter sp.]|nr:hypothetical protein [Candidatus Sulfopaludibacter sp.]